MKEETYKKAIKRHEKELAEFGDKLFDLVIGVVGSGISALEAIGMLESVKAALLSGAASKANTERAMDALEDMLSELFGEEDDYVD